MTTTEIKAVVKARQCYNELIDELINVVDERNLSDLQPLWKLRNQANHILDKLTDSPVVPIKK